MMYGWAKTSSDLGMETRMETRVVWVGKGPGAGVVARLEAMGVGVSRTPGEGTICVVVATGAGEVPKGDGERPWVWLPGKAPEPAAVAAATAAGAYDVLPAGCGVEALCERLLARVAELETPLLPPPGPATFVAESPAGVRLLAELAHAARTSMPVLLTGETGTGKE